MLKEKTKIFYALSFLGGLHGSIVAPFFVVFGLSLGIDIVRVGILFGVIRLTIFLFEIPTGIFADTYGRKKSVLICYFLSVIFSLIYFYASNFYLLLLGSLIMGIALTFISGAFEALAVDSLGLNDDDHSRNKVFVRLGMSSNVGFILGGAGASFLAYYDIRNIWLGQAIIAILALVLGWLFLKEKFYPDHVLDRGRAVTLIVEKIKKPAISIFRNTKLLTMFLISVAVAFASALFIISWPLILKNILFVPLYYFGIISSVAGIFYLAGSILAERIAIKIGTLKTITASMISIGILYIIFAISKNIVLSLFAFMFIDFFNGGYNPLFYSMINKFIPSPQRATILSFYSLFEGGGSGFGEAIGGKLLSIISAPLVIALSPVFILVSTIAFLFKKSAFNVQKH